MITKYMSYPKNGAWDTARLVGKISRTVSDDAHYKVLTDTPEEAEAQSVNAGPAGMQLVKVTFEEI